MSFQLQSPLFQAGATQKLHRIAFTGDVRDLVNNYPDGDLDLTDFGTQLATYNNHVADYDNLAAQSNDILGRVNVLENADNLNMQDVGGVQKSQKLIDLSNAVASAQGDATAAGNQATTNLASINTINSTLTTVQSNISTNTSAISTNASDIGSIDTRVGTLEGTSSSHGTRLTDIETKNTTQDTQIATINTTLATKAAQSSMTQAEADIVGLRTDTDTNTTNISTINSDRITRKVIALLNENPPVGGKESTEIYPGCIYIMVHLASLQQAISEGKLVARPTDGSSDIDLFDFSEVGTGPAIQGTAMVGKIVPGNHKLVITATQTSGTAYLTMYPMSILV